MLFYYLYFKKNYRELAIAISKQLALYVDPLTVQQINFNGNFDRNVNKQCFHFRVKVIDISKKRAPDVGPRTVQQINFYRNIDMLIKDVFNLEQGNKITLDILQGTMKIISNAQQFNKNL